MKLIYYRLVIATIQINQYTIVQVHRGHILISIGRLHVYLTSSEIRNLAYPGECFVLVYLKVKLEPCSVIFARSNTFHLQFDLSYTSSIYLDPYYIDRVRALKLKSTT